ncbi:MAG: cupredoxin domain-containing protein [Longimicrobiales bacterium]
MRLAFALVLIAATSCKPAPGVHEVTIRNFRFEPGTVSVATGDTVRWRNADLLPHTASASNRAWDSGSLSAGAVWQVPFPESGTYPYQCDAHPTMRGVVVVK